MKQTRVSKDELFSSVSVPKALLTMAVPTVISQAINLIYNMVDAFFVGRTGNSYMMAATSLTLTMVMMNAALGNLFGIGAGRVHLNIHRSRNVLIILCNRSSRRISCGKTAGERGQTTSVHGKAQALSRSGRQLG